MQRLWLCAGVSSQRSSCKEHQSCVHASIPPSRDSCVEGWSRSLWKARAWKLPSCLPPILQIFGLRRGHICPFGLKLPSSSSSVLSKRRWKAEFPLPNADREKRGAMDIGTDENGHAGDWGVPLAPYSQGKLGCPAPATLWDTYLPYLGKIKPAFPNSSPHTTAPVVAGDQERWAGCGPSMQGHTMHPAQPQRGFYNRFLPTQHCLPSPLRHFLIRYL